MWHKTPCGELLSVIICLAAMGTSRLTAEDSHVLAKFDFEGNAPLANWGVGVNGKYAPFNLWKSDALPCALKIDAAESHSGLACVRIEAPKGSEDAQVMHLYTGGFKINAAASEAGKVRVRLFARTQGVKENAVNVSMLEHAKSKPIGYAGARPVFMAIPSSPSWTEIDGARSFDSNTESFVLMFVFNLKELAGGTIWIDDISVEQTK